jgi:hypothetical protein
MMPLSAIFASSMRSITLRVCLKVNMRPIFDASPSAMPRVFEQTMRTLVPPTFSAPEPSCRHVANRYG